MTAILPVNPIAPFDREKKLTKKINEFVASNYMRDALTRGNVHYSSTFPDQKYRTSLTSSLTKGNLTDHFAPKENIPFSRHLFRQSKRRENHQPVHNKAPRTSRALRLQREYQLFHQEPGNSKRYMRMLNQCCSDFIENFATMSHR